MQVNRLEPLVCKYCERYGRMACTTGGEQKETYLREQTTLVEWAVLILSLLLLFDTVTDKSANGRITLEYFTLEYSKGIESQWTYVQI